MTIFKFLSIESPIKLTPKAKKSLVKGQAWLKSADHKLVNFIKQEEFKNLSPQLIIEAIQDALNLTNEGEDPYFEGKLYCELQA